MNEMDRFEVVQVGDESAWRIKDNADGTCGFVAFHNLAEAQAEASTMNSKRVVKMYAVPR